MGDSLEQTIAGLNNLTLSLPKIYENSSTNLCIIGYDDMYNIYIYILLFIVILIIYSNI